MISRHKPIAEERSPAAGTDVTFENIWRLHCKELFKRSEMPPPAVLRRALNYAIARLRFQVYRHATFEELSSAGYDVRTYDDGAVPLEPKKFTRRDLPERWKIPQPSIVPKIATLRDATLLENGSALLPDGRCSFSDTRFAGRNWRRPKKFGAEARFFFHASRFSFYANHASDSVLVRPHMRSIDVSGRCFSTFGSYVWNFGHFVHDILSRIHYEDLGAIVPGRDKVIAPPLRNPISRNLFHKIFEDYEIVEAPRGVNLRVEELLLPANLCSRSAFNPLAIAELAKKLRRISSNYADNEKNKICVSREDSSGNERREFINEEAYETLMGKLGYRILNVSKFGPEEQFALWANTTDIVGIHGAGMMNIMMMPPGGNYTEIAGMRPGFSCPNWTARCAMASGHKVGVQGCEPDARDRLEIDLDRLEALLLDAS